MIGTRRKCIIRSSTQYYWSDRINKRLVVNVACIIGRKFGLYWENLKIGSFLNLRCMYKLPFGTILTYILQRQGRRQKINLLHDMDQWQAIANEGCKFSGALKTGKFLTIPLSCLISEESYLTVNTWRGLFVC